MAPQRRRTAFPKVVIERDTESEQSTSSSDEDDSGEDNKGSDSEEEMAEEKVEEEDANERKKNQKGKAPIITISLKKVCKVCKKSGHEAGFKGATYIDCPMKPCFLCKLPGRLALVKRLGLLALILNSVIKYGHTTMSCPHRVAIEHGVVPAPRRSTHSPLDYVFQRQIMPKIPPVVSNVLPSNCGLFLYLEQIKPSYVIPNQKGQVGIWDFEKVHEKMVYGNIHTCIVNNMRFNPVNDGTIYAASSDGTISCIDLETGLSSSLMNLNPNGWQGSNSWRMLYGMDMNSEKRVVLVADNFGFLYIINCKAEDTETAILLRVDTRSNHKTGDAIMIHKKGSKVVGLHCNPVHPELLLSCGNDHFARIWDMRRLEAGSSLYNLPHKRVVNSAYFSPTTGCKILTTAQDNRLRVWDSIFGDLESPSREIVHSHDFNRHLTPFRAEWDPKDPTESLAVVGRYISENFNGAALHPIDFIDTSNGQLVAEVMDPNITTISPVNKLHPRDDVLASGSSRSLFIWRPSWSPEVDEQKEERRILICGNDEKRRKKKSGNDSDVEDDDLDGGFKSKGKKKQSLKLKVTASKSAPPGRKVKH
uniref:Putative damaged DNA-binding 2 n=1 Tax=Linum usitatissimum TaxID=4006 RepID=A0A172MLF5_LINUS|nr:putative damaged DNA-binding 2 [Linum usitatissimum]